MAHAGEARRARRLLSQVRRRRRRPRATIQCTMSRKARPARRRQGCAAPGPRPARPREPERAQATDAPETDAAARKARPSAEATPAGRRKRRGCPEEEIVDNTSCGTFPFKKEAYRLPTFEVLLNAPQQVPLDGEFNVDLLARYFAGGLVAERPIKWRAVQFPHAWTPPGREGFMFSTDARFSGDAQVQVVPRAGARRPHRRRRRRAHHLRHHHRADRPAAPLPDRSHRDRRRRHPGARRAERRRRCRPSCWV